MKMQEVRAIARELGLKTGGLSKAKAIHCVQLAEGNFDCYGRAVDGFCDQMECRFRDDCLEPPAK